MDAARETPLPMIRFLPNPQIEREIGRRLEVRRLELHLSRQVVASRSGLPHQTVVAIENGEGASLAALIAMLRAMNSLDTLESFLPGPGAKPAGGEKPSPTRFPAGDLWKWGAAATAAR